MIDEQPEMYGQSSEVVSGKLVLPGYGSESRQAHWDVDEHDMHTTHIPQDQVQLYHALPPSSYTVVLASNSLRPVKKSSDPAYKILLVAIAFVIIAGIVVTAMATNIFAQITASSNSNGQSAVLPTNVPKGATPTGGVDLQPVFPTPGGGQGSTATSQPPSTGTQTLPTPVTTVQATPTQSGNGGNGQLSVQILNPPQQVSNGSVVQISVTTGQPGISVRLFITYNALPFVSGSGPQTTDDAGNATLPWRVHVNVFGNTHIVAHIIAVGQDQTGQQVQSSPITVDIMTHGNMGG